jgi:ornithine cyclodeaminase/alanine dehydrogenase-like protein (mu-crystallin family)
MMPGHIPAETKMIADATPELDAKIRELGPMMVGQVDGRISDEQITVFGGSGSGGSSGLGIQFAAVGYVILKAALERKIGREIPTDWFLEDVHP